MRVASSGVGALRLATAKASMMKKLIFFSRIVLRNCAGSSAQTCSGVPEDCRMKVPAFGQALERVGVHEGAVVRRDHDFNVFELGVGDLDRLGDSE